jgi:hypothetical protein
MDQPKIPYWRNTLLVDLPGEEWRDVVGYDGLYSVSNYGRVKSMARYNERGHWLKEKVLRINLSREGTVGVSKENVATTRVVMSLVGEAFLPPKKEDEVYIRKNKVRYDSRLANLKIGTRSESAQLDRVIGVKKNDSAAMIAHKKQEQQAYLAKFGVYQDGALVAKICTCCTTERPLSAFSVQNGNWLGRLCKTCVLTRAGVQEVGKAAYLKRLAAEGLRRCSRCKAEKPLAAFGIERQYGQGNKTRKSRCRDCINTLEKARRASKAAARQSLAELESAILTILFQLQTI